MQQIAKKESTWFLVITFVFFLSIWASGFTIANFAFAQDIQTTDVLQQKIQQLQKQIADLQSKLAELQTKPQETTTTTTSAFTRTLSRGVSGNDVKELQGFLKKSPDIYPEGLITGYFGPLTEAAVKKFQGQNGIESVGIVGPKTQAKLNELATSGTRQSDNIPSGLQTASGLQEKPPASTSTPSGSIPAVPATSVQTIKIAEIDCNKKDFTMALIFVADNITDPSMSRYSEEINYVKNRFPWAFNFATRGLATMTISSEPFIMNSKSIHLSSTNDINPAEVLRKFYENHNDDYDFVSIFTNVKGSSWGTQYYHTDVKNDIKNIGKPIFDNTANFGSNGRLMGINFMNDMFDRNSDVRDCYKEQNGKFGQLTGDTNCGMGGILHETAHQWVAYVGDIVPGTQVGVTGSTPDKPLSIRSNGAHYYYGLDAPAGTDSLNGSIHWNKAVTGSSYIDDSALNGSTILLKYHPFTLYFMGLLPENEYDTKFNVFQNLGKYVLTESEYYAETNNTFQDLFNKYGVLNPTFPVSSMESIYNQVSVRDIITRAGVRQCGPTK